MDKKFNISITGASGLLGTYMTKQFISQGHSLKCHRNKSNIPVELNDYDLEWIQGDIRDQYVVNQLILDCDVIIHCAAIVSFDKKDLGQMMSINIQGTKALVDNLIGKSTKLIHISSIAALGRVDKAGEIDEKVVFNSEVKNSAYAQSKYLSELEVYRAIAEGVNGMILSPSVILGKNERSSSSATIWKQILKFPTFAPKGANGFVDVRDVVQAAENCLVNWRDGEKFIINGHNISYLELYSKVLNYRKMKVKPAKVSPFLLLMILPFARLYFFLTRTSSKISKEAILSTSRTYSYSNAKSISQLGVNYHSLEASLSAFL
jgi:nucleoside-diphosphate-sugar epimerase